LGVARPFPSKRRSPTLSHPRIANQSDCVPKVGVLQTGDSSTRETDCALPKPVFATMEEVRRADELRLQLRARLLRDGAAAGARPYSVGAD
jgi:hypothetical protein